MRLPDEKQLYRKGDKVTTVEGMSGVISSVSTHSVYYEARPIASYTRYTYVMTCVDGNNHYLKADEIVRVS